MQNRKHGMRNALYSVSTHFMVHTCVLSLLLQYYNTTHRQPLLIACRNTASSQITLPYCNAKYFVARIIGTSYYNTTGIITKEIISWVLRVACSVNNSDSLCLRSFFFIIPSMLSRKLEDFEKCN
jgi:hypothetical protein